MMNEPITLERQKKPKESEVFQKKLCKCLEDKKKSLYFAIVLQTSGVSDGQFEVLQRLNPVSPMDDRDRGCRESVTLGRAGLTLHRWFDVIAVCAS